MNSVSIDNHVLVEVSIGGPSFIMGNSRLVNGPVVQRRVGNRVSGSQLDEVLVGRSLLDGNFIRTNSHVEAEGHVLSTGGVHEDGVNVYWDTTLLD